MDGEDTLTFLQFLEIVGIFTICYFIVSIFVCINRSRISDGKRGLLKIPGLNVLLCVVLFVPYIFYQLFDMFVNFFHRETVKLEMVPREDYESLLSSLFKERDNVHELQEEAKLNESELDTMREDLREDARTIRDLRHRLYRLDPEFLHMEDDRK